MHPDAVLVPANWESVTRRPAVGEPDVAPRKRVDCYVAARVGITASVVSLALTVLLGAAAPNANTADMRGPLTVLPSLPPDASQPLAWLSNLLAGLGLSALLWAYHHGWRPDVKKLLIFSTGITALLVNLSPVGSSDAASYAAYGRLYATGMDPYHYSPWWLGDAYMRIVDVQWLHTRSVYGPLATLTQATAALLGENVPATTIWLLMVANGAIFLLVGLLLRRVGSDPVRATLLWTANPLLIQQLVGGGHLDTVIVAAAVTAVFLTGRSLAAGGLLGLACGVKANAALVGVGLAWERLRRRDYLGLAKLGVVAAAVLAAVYGFIGWHALDPLFEATNLVSGTSLWSLIGMLLNLTVGSDVATAIIRFGWPVALFSVAVVLWRMLPKDAPWALRAQFTLAFAWVVVAPWVMPWYAALAWGFLALLPPNRLTPWLVGYTVVLACLHNSGGSHLG